MIGRAAEEKFSIRALTALAKASFSNLELLAYLERGLSDSEVDARLKQLLSTEERAAFAKVEVSGRFLRLRWLYPSLTDEALEHRIAWAMERLVKQEPKFAEQNRQEPAACLLHLLSGLAQCFLCEARDGSLRIRSRLLAEWQDLILVVPPMLITAAWIAAQPGSTGDSISERRAFQRRVQLWLCDSTLPIDDHPFLDQLCKAEGLDETHLHLNGSTEAEKIWIDALRNSSKVVGALSGAVKSEDGLHTPIGNGVDRLLRQEDPALTPKLLRQRIEQAVALKTALLTACSGNQSVASDLSLEIRYAAAVRGRPVESGLSVTTAEMLQLIDIITWQAKGNSSDRDGIAFLWYCLIRAQFCRLLVQQVGQVGFDQFQYITRNELRETTEKDFAERFRQIERGVQQPVAFLEGRFAPKTTPDGTASRLRQILLGYLQFLDEEPDGTSRGILPRIFSDPKNLTLSLAQILKLVRDFEHGTVGKGEAVLQSQRRLRLGLVVHFIKQTDSAEWERFLKGDYVGPVCRDSQVRRQADQSARALIVLMDNTPGLSAMIRGGDAASNERHAGPEVFAQVFRRMRRAGMQRFTYHAGEDFVHIASGLRAINEAVRFLELSAGCRIGHGTAAGIIPAKWWLSVGGAVIQPLEDRLDDLVFAWGTLIDTGQLLDRLPRLDLEIRRLAMQIWKDPALTPDLLLRAWQLRHLDPIAHTYGHSDVDPHRNSEILRFRDSERQDPGAHAQFLRRHGVGMSRDARQHARQGKILITSEADILDVEVLEVLQSATLTLLKQQCIAIETLPSSNLRISIHQSYEDHHAAGWIGLNRNFGPVSVVVGSDDPGIFATSLRMEYAHLLRALEANSAGTEAEVVLERINKTSKRFRF